MGSISVRQATVNIAMIRRNLCYLLVLSLAFSCAFASEENEKSDGSEKKDEKSVAKRGIHHYSSHGHIHPAVVSATHYHLPPAVPTLLKFPVVHKPVLPAPALIPAQLPHYHLTHGGASVTSHSVNYPRYPVLARPAIIPDLHHHHHHVAPHFHRHVPHFHSHLAPAIPHLHAHAGVPHLHAHATLPHLHSAVPHYHAAPSIPHVHVAPAAPCHSHLDVPHYHTSVLPHVHVPAKPLIPVAVPVPGIRYPKVPVIINRPVYPQFAPAASPNPTFVPIPVPSNPQPPVSGSDANTNFIPATIPMPQIPQPTQPTLPPPPTMPSVTYGWRPVGMMMNNLRPQATRPTFTNKPPYNYHAPAVPFNHAQTSSPNEFISGHGQMSSQLYQQLAHYQQQQQYIQQPESKCRV